MPGTHLADRQAGGFVVLRAGPREQAHRCFLCGRRVGTGRSVLRASLCHDHEHCLRPFADRRRRRCGIRRPQRNRAATASSASLRRRAIPCRAARRRPDPQEPAVRSRRCARRRRSPSPTATCSGACAQTKCCRTPPCCNCPSTTCCRTSCSRRPVLVASLRSMPTASHRHSRSSTSSPNAAASPTFHGRAVPDGRAEVRHSRQQQVARRLPDRPQFLPGAGARLGAGGEQAVPARQRAGSGQGPHVLDHGRVSAERADDGAGRRHRPGQLRRQTCIIVYDEDGTRAASLQNVRLSSAQSLMTLFQVQGHPGLPLGA